MSSTSELMHRSENLSALEKGCTRCVRILRAALRTRRPENRADADLKAHLLAYIAALQPLLYLHMRWQPLGSDYRVKCERCQRGGRSFEGVSHEPYCEIGKAVEARKRVLVELRKQGEGLCLPSL